MNFMSLVIFFATLGNFSFAASIPTPSEVLANNRVRSLGFINSPDHGECYFDHIKSDEYVEYGNELEIYGMPTEPNQYQGELSINSTSSTLTFCPYDMGYEKLACNYRTSFAFGFDLKIQKYTVYRNDIEYFTCTLKP